MISRINDWIAVRANATFATMGFFWFCFVFALLPLKWPSMMPFVQYASSGVLQLVALPLLGVGTILAARSSDAQAKEQHDTILKIAAEMHAALAELHALHVELHGKLGPDIE